MSDSKLPDGTRDNLISPKRTIPEINYASCDASILSYTVVL